MTLILEEHLDFSPDIGVSHAVIDEKGHELLAHAGLAHIKTGRKLNKDSRFRMGSNTKMLLGIVLMKRVEQGYLSVDDTVSKYLPEYKKWRDITVQQLMGMTSGVPEYIGSKKLKWKQIWDHDREFTPQKLLKAVAKKDLEFRPGSRCDYSNTNFIILGEVLERATGRTFGYWLEKDIIEPLGLKNTYIDFGRSDKRLAHGYIDFDASARMFGLPRLFYYLFPKSLRTQDRLVDLTSYYHPTFTGAAGAVISTPIELARVVRALFHGEFITQSSLDFMKQTQPCKIAGSDWNYGHAMMHYDLEEGRAYGHGGLTFGYRSTTLHFPKLDYTFSQAQNIQPEMGGVLFDELMHASFQVGEERPIRKPHRCSLRKVIPEKDYITFKMSGGLNAGISAEVRYEKHIDFHRISTELKRDGDFLTFESTGLEYKKRHLLNLFYAKIPSTYVQKSGETRDPEIQAHFYRVKEKKAGVLMACLEGVLEQDKRAFVQSCGSKLTPRDDQPVRLLGKLKMTTRNRKIKDYAKAHGLNKCICFDKDGSNTPCP